MVLTSGSKMCPRSRRQRDPGPRCLPRGIRASSWVRGLRVRARATMQTHTQHSRIYKASPPRSNTHPPTSAPETAGEASPTWASAQYRPPTPATRDRASARASRVRTRPCKRTPNYTKRPPCSNTHPTAHAPELAEEASPTPAAARSRPRAPAAQDSRVRRGARVAHARRNTKRSLPTNPKSDPH